MYGLGILKEMAKVCKIFRNKEGHSACRRNGLLKHYCCINLITFSPSKRYHRQELLLFIVILLVWEFMLGLHRIVRDNSRHK